MANARYLGRSDEQVRAFSAPKKARKVGDVLRSIMAIPKKILTNFGTTNKKS